MTIKDIERQKGGGWEWRTFWLPHENKPSWLGASNTCRFCTDARSEGLFRLLGNSPFTSPIIPPNKLTFQGFLLVSQTAKGKRTAPLDGKIRRVMHNISAPGWELK